MVWGLYCCMCVRQCRFTCNSIFKTVHVSNSHWFKAFQAQWTLCPIFYVIILIFPLAPITTPMHCQNAHYTISTSQSHTLRAELSAEFIWRWIGMTSLDMQHCRGYTYCQVSTEYCKFLWIYLIQLRLIAQIQCPIPVVQGDYRRFWDKLVRNRTGWF